MSLFRSFFRDERGSFAANFAKSAIAIGFISVLAANFISRQIDTSDRQRLDQAAAQAARGQNVDRMATGSLARDVQATKVDPCALPQRR